MFRLLTVILCKNVLDISILKSNTYESKDDAQKSYLVIRDAVNGKTSATSVDHIPLGEKSDQELCARHNQSKTLRFEPDANYLPWHRPRTKVAVMSLFCVPDLTL